MTTTKLELVAPTIKEFTKYCGLISLEFSNKNNCSLKEGEHSINRMLDTEKVMVYRLTFNSNNYYKDYFVVITKANCKWQLCILKGNTGLPKLPSFVLVNIVQTLEKHFNRMFVLDVAKIMPDIRYYSKFLLKNKNWELEGSQNTAVYNMGFVDYYGLDDASRRILEPLVIDTKGKSLLLHTTKQLKYVKTGRNPYSYFYETDGEYYPQYAKEEVSIAYKHHDTFTATEAWCTNKHAEIDTSAAPEIYCDLFTRVWDANQNKYVRGAKIDTIKLTKEVQQNLVDGFSNNNMILFDTKNISIKSDKVSGDILFPVVHKPVSYAEHNNRHAVLLNEFNQWLNENLGEKFRENVYKDIHEYLKYNHILPERNIGEDRAIKMATKIGKLLNLPKMRVVKTSIGSKYYICLMQCLKVLAVVPFRSESSYYENYGDTDDDADEIKASNTDLEALKDEAERYAWVLNNHPGVSEITAVILKKLL